MILSPWLRLNVKIEIFVNWDTKLDSENYTVSVSHEIFSRINMKIFDSFFMFVQHPFNSDQWVCNLKNHFLTVFHDQA